MTNLCSFSDSIVVAGIGRTGDGGAENLHLGRRSSGYHKPFQGASFSIKSAVAQNRYLVSIHRVVHIEDLTFHQHVLPFIPEPHSDSHRLLWYFLLCAWKFENSSYLYNFEPVPCPMSPFRPALEFSEPGRFDCSIAPLGPRAVDQSEIIVSISMKRWHASLCLALVRLLLFLFLCDRSSYSLSDLSVTLFRNLVFPS